MRRTVLLTLSLLLAVALAPSATRADGFGPLLNAWRGSQSAPPMARSAALDRAASRHAADMASHGYFSHSGRDGSTVQDRARRAGFRACRIAENIAKGQSGPQEVLRAWSGSRGHKRNLAMRRATHFGYAMGPGDIHVLILASPC